MRVKKDVKGRLEKNLADIPSNDTIIWCSHSRTHPAVRILSHSILVFRIDQHGVCLFVNDRKQMKEVKTNRIGKSLDYPSEIFRDLKYGNFTVKRGI